MAGSAERDLCAGRPGDSGSGYVGTLIFGLIKRALIPFGLHHVFYMPFWQTAVAEPWRLRDKMVQGDRIYSLPSWLILPMWPISARDATRYFSGEFIFMIFGLPGAALGCTRCAKPEKKKRREA